MNDWSGLQDDTQPVVDQVKGDPGGVIPNGLLMSGFYPNDGGDPSKISEDPES